MQPEQRKMSDTISEHSRLRKLETVEQTELFDIIDSFRAHGLGDITALPQLIVCGDQSSGKSSVLEAISGLPFPRKDGLCTRFATEVILRRSFQTTITVSIVPSSDRLPKEITALRGFRQELATIQQFSSLFDLAIQAMGLEISNNTFSKDLLRIEYSSPLQPQLTLVDLPGLIHAAHGQQTNDDIEAIKNLVSSYLKNPRSIILAIVSAKSDISSQIILKQAREIDGDGVRTLGIITKPDLLIRGSNNERDFLKLARNEDIKFELGWHVVKNLDSITPLTSSEHRDELEAQYFRESSFQGLPSHILGIDSLREKLSHVLFKQIRSELPKLQDEIRQRIHVCKIQRNRLGPGRPNITQQREFLVTLSQDFQSVCRDAIKGDYENAFFKNTPTDNKRLCAVVMNLHSSFAREMRRSGSTWITDNEAISEKIAEGENAIASQNLRNRKQAIVEACALLNHNRGRELLGLANPLLVGELFRIYSKPWESIARLHIKSVWDSVTHFLSLLLEHLADADTADKLKRFWLYPVLETKLQIANRKLDELMEAHKEHPMTFNYSFMQKRKALHAQRNKATIQKRLEQAYVSFKGTIPAQQLADIVSSPGLEHEEDMDFLAAEEAYDNMSAYYQMARDLFIDNVPMLCLQLPLVRDVPNLFCPTRAFSMSEELVSKIAAESVEKTQRRSELNKTLGTLEAGARVCGLYSLSNSKALTSPRGSSLRQHVNGVADSKNTQNFGVASNSSVKAAPHMPKTRSVGEAESVFLDPSYENLFNKKWTPGTTFGPSSGFLGFKTPPPKQTAAIIGGASGSSPSGVASPNSDITNYESSDSNERY